VELLFGRGCQSPFDEQEQVVGHLLDAPDVCHRDAQQLADDGSRQREGEVADHIHPSLAGRAVEQLVHQALDERLQRIDSVRGEALVDETAQARVLRGIGDGHHPTHEVEQRLQAGLAGLLLHGSGTA